MKKWFFFGISMLLLCSLAACGNTKAEEVTSPSEQVEVIKETPAPTIVVETEAVHEEQKEPEETAEPKEEIIWLESDEEWEAARNKSNDTLEVTVEREDRSIKDANGNVIARMYYDRPVVSGNSEVAEKINAFFEEEEESWFGGKSGRLTWFQDDYLDCFLEGVEKMRKQYGDEIMEVSPCLYTVDTRIEYLDGETLSIFQIRNFCWERKDLWYYGSTFDLTTGELLQVTEIKDILAEDMRRIMANASYPSCYQNISDKYIMQYYDLKIDMRYEYFWDGTYLYLIDNSGKYFCDGIVIRCGNGEKPVILQHIVKHNGTETGRIQTEKIIY